MENDIKRNHQLYGRNDMIMIDEHNKIYGSLGIAEQYIVGTEQGESLVLKGAKDNEPFLGLSIYGKSTQNTTIGAQLFDYKTALRSQIESGIVSINESGQIVLSGIIDISNRIFQITLQPGTYYFSADSAVLWHILAPTDLEFNISLTVAEETTYNCYINSGTYSNQVTTPMINLGSFALPWEPYTGGQPSPNPDYPQEIEITGKDGEIGVDVYGGNFVLNPEEVVHFEGNIGDGVNSLGLSKFIAIVAEEQLLKNDISFSFDSDGGSESNFSILFRTKYGTEYKFSKEGIVLKIINGRNIAEFSKSAFTNLLATGVDELAVQIRPTNPLIDDVNFNITNLMLNIGSTALPFEPYKQPQSLIVSTPNGLPGIPVSSGGNYTDESGQQWVSDEIDFKRGKYVQKIGKFVVTNDSYVESMNLYATGSLDVVQPFRVKEWEGEIIKLSKLMSENIQCTYSWNVAKECAWAIEHTIDFNISNERLGTNTETSSDEAEEALKEWLADNPLTFYAQLTSPIETDLTPEQITAYQSLHTNYPTTTVLNDEGAGMKAIYKQIENGG